MQCNQSEISRNSCRKMYFYLPTIVNNRNLTAMPLQLYWLLVALICRTSIKLTDRLNFAVRSKFMNVIKSNLTNFAYEKFENELWKKFQAPKLSDLSQKPSEKLTIVLNELNKHILNLFLCPKHLTVSFIENRFI